MCIIDFTTTPQTKEQKRLDKIWNSKGKRFKVPRFRCDFCVRIRYGESYSVVDGGKSCLKCDEEENH